MAEGHGPSAAFHGQQVRSSGGRRSRLHKLPSGALCPSPDVHIIQPFCPEARAGFQLHLSDSHLKAGLEWEWERGG